MTLVTVDGETVRLTEPQALALVSAPKGGCAMGNVQALRSLHHMGFVEQPEYIQGKWYATYTEKAKRVQWPGEPR
jgi:hypothetical protein